MTWSVEVPGLTSGFATLLRRSASLLTVSHAHAHRCFDEGHFAHGLAPEVGHDPRGIVTVCVYVCVFEGGG